MRSFDTRGQDAARAVNDLPTLQLFASDEADGAEVTLDKSNTERETEAACGGGRVDSGGTSGTPSPAALGRFCGQIARATSGTEGGAGGRIATGASALARTGSGGGAELEHDAGVGDGMRIRGADKRTPYGGGAEAAAARRRAVGMAGLRARQQGYELALAQAAEAASQYPELDLFAELEHADFARLLSAGIPVQTAYEVVHKDALLRSGIQLAAQRLANALRANAARPVENGVAAVAASVQQPDPKALTHAERLHLRERVRRGERVVW